MQHLRLASNILNTNTKQSVPNVDVIQVKTICCNTEIGFRLPQLFNSWSGLPSSHVPAKYHRSHITFRTQYWKNQSLHSLSLPFTINEISFTLQFLLHALFLNIVCRCGNNWLHLCTECAFRLVCWLSASGMKYWDVKNVANITMFHNLNVQWLLLDSYRCSVLCLVSCLTEMYRLMYCTAEDCIS